MVRKTYTARPRLTYFPLHHLMIEAEAFATLHDKIQAFHAENQAFCVKNQALRDENQFLRERLMTLKDERTETQNLIPLPLILTPPIPAPVPPSFKQSVEECAVKSLSKKVKILIQPLEVVII